MDQKDINAQLALYNSRRAKLMADQEKNSAAIAQELAAIESAQAQKQKYKALYDVAYEKEQRLEDLFRESAVSYFQLLEGRAARVEYQKSNPSSLP